MIVAGPSSSARVKVLGKIKTVYQQLCLNMAVTLILASGCSVAEVDIDNNHLLLSELKGVEAQPLLCFRLPCSVVLLTLSVRLVCRGCRTRRP
eukprot:3074477-Amphidinium_carterae.1